MKYPDINGLKSSLIITKRSYHYSDDECNGRFLQVIHTGNHWIIASNLGGEINEVTVYDSLYHSVEKRTHDVLKRLLKCVKVNVFGLQPQVQKGIHDCGLFCMAFSFSLADLSTIRFEHLEACFESKQLTSFPKL